MAIITQTADELEDVGVGLAYPRDRRASDFEDDVITLTDTNVANQNGGSAFAGQLDVRSGGGDDTIIITDGTDSGNDEAEIYGESGNDTITVDYTSAPESNSNDEIRGGFGDDTLNIIESNDSAIFDFSGIFGGFGSDTFNIDGGTNVNLFGLDGTEFEDNVDSDTFNITSSGGDDSFRIWDFSYDLFTPGDNDILIINGVVIDLADLADDGIVSGVTIDSEYNILLGNSVFTLADGSTLTLDNFQISCFVTGTQIATPAGEVAVETLAIGDEVTTTEGKTAAIKWMGYREVSATFAKKNAGAQPVLITADALGNGLPTADLRVSPDHAMHIDGVLIHAEALVNGSTIVREAITHSFAYYHIELEQHDLVLANGAPTETFVDADGRGRFDNAAEYQALYGNAASAAPMALPRIKSKRQLPAAIKAKLDQAKTA
ncbi:MAG: Hint domain-containing protein [Pseudomonadota bacterium]|nr:Hint domain-containing protein [Pseudomonadota bacterium]